MCSMPSRRRYCRQSCCLKRWPERRRASLHCRHWHRGTDSARSHVSRSLLAEDSHWLQEIRTSVEQWAYAKGGDEQKVIYSSWLDRTHREVEQQIQEYVQGLPDRTKEDTERLFTWHFTDAVMSEIGVAEDPDVRKAVGSARAAIFVARDGQTLATEVKDEYAEVLLCPTRVQRLATDGFLVLDNIFEPAHWNSLRQSIDLVAPGFLHVAQKQCTQYRATWFDVKKRAIWRSMLPALEPVVNLMRGVAHAIAGTLPTEDLRSHLSVPHSFQIIAYDRGAGYVCHLDSHGPEDTPYLWTVIFYVNPSWTHGDGGELCGYADEAKKHLLFEVAPRAGTLLIFDSRKVWHEVALQKGSCSRICIQLWLYSRIA